MERREEILTGVLSFPQQLLTILKIENDINKVVLVEDFFQPCGRSEQEILVEYETVSKSKILKLEHVNNLDIKDPYYVPLAYIQETPDHRVKQYFDIGVISSLGITEEPEDLDFAIAALTEQFEAAMGITPDPYFVTTQEMWLTEADYKAVLAERDAAKKKVINYYSECKRLQEVIIRMKTTIASYEEIMIKQHKQLESLLAERVPEEDADG